MQRQVLPERDLEEGRRKERREPGVPGFSLGFIRAEEMTNDLSEQLSQTFVPTLTLMKLSGQFFGETSFSELRDLNPGKLVYLSRFYSLLVVLSLWLFVILGLASLFSEGFTSVDVFLYLFNIAAWSVQCACNVTICLALLPQVQSKSRSRFSQFITSFSTTTTDLKGLRRKSLKGLAFAGMVSLGNFAFALLWSFYINGVLYKYKPWNGNMGVRIIETGVGIYTSFAWSLPVQLYYTTCLVLERMFETLKDKVASSLDTDHPFTLSSLRQEYLRLCKVLEMADKVFSPFLLVTVALDVPLICVNLYQVIKITKNWSNEENTISFFAHMFWSVCLSSIVSLLCLFGGRVNEKVRSRVYKRQFKQTFSLTGSCSKNLFKQISIAMLAKKAIEISFQKS